MPLEFNILQLEKLGVIFELLADITFIKTINLEEIEIEKKENEKEEHFLKCNPNQLRVLIRLLYLIGRIILAIAILKEYMLQRYCIETTNDVKKLQSTYKILIGEWIVVLGTLLTFIGAKEM